MLYILFTIVYFLIAWILANEFHAIAEDKGYHSRKYFWYVLLFGIFGCLLVCAMPDRKPEQMAARFQAPGADSEHTISPDPCPNYPRSQEPLVPQRGDDDQIICPICGTEQPEGCTWCVECGQSFQK